jgi:hypothetical protein
MSLDALQRHSREMGLLLNALANANKEVDERLGTARSRPARERTDALEYLANMMEIINRQVEGENAIITSENERAALKTQIAEVDRKIVRHLSKPTYIGSMGL